MIELEKVVALLCAGFVIGISFMAIAAHFHVGTLCARHDFPQTTEWPEAWACVKKGQADDRADD